MLKVWELRISEAGMGAKLSTVVQYIMFRRLTEKAWAWAHPPPNPLFINGQRDKSNDQLHRNLNLEDCNTMLFWTKTALQFVNTKQPHALLWYRGRTK